MTVPTYLLSTAAVALTLVLAPAGTPHLLARQAPPTHAVTWPDQREAVEDALRRGVVERFDDIPVGVTRPKRAFFKPPSPVRSAAWKPLLPGIYKGFWESYKSEIAAYELDKLLGLDMVPPVVERRIDGQTGAIVMWVDGVKGWDQNVEVTPPQPQDWARQVVRMKMFDQLIANIDRNQGNLIYDGDYHLILIDHSRAFTSTTEMKRMAAPGRYDEAFWQRLDALTADDLRPALGRWIGRGEISAILKRRDKMRTQIEATVKQRGAAATFIR